MASTNFEYRCFVGGLAWATNDQALENAFSTFGDILESKIGRQEGQGRGFGFVILSNGDGGYGRREGGSGGYGSGSRGGGGGSCYSSRGGDSDGNWRS